MGEPDDHGYRTAIFNYNGQIRPVKVRDEAASVQVVAREKADADIEGHIPAPFSGAVTVAVPVGTDVEAGATVATIEAMKMEAAITTPVGGKITRILVKGTETLAGGDLVLVIE